MDAGRALDALIAEKVCRGLAADWRSVCLVDAHTLDEDTWCYDCHGLVNEQERIPERYSTDIAAAWLVVEALHQRGVCVSVSALHGWNTKYECSVHHESVLDTVASGEADTAPLAICRAALAAVQE